MATAVWVRVPSLAPKKRTPNGVLFFGIWGGTRKPGLSEARVKNSPVDCFSGRGRVPQISGASGTDVNEI